MEGGTHNPFAPPFEFLERVFLPVLRKLGVDASLTLEETGFAPAGGGRISAIVKPCAALGILDFHDRGTQVERNITVVSRRLRDHIPARMLDSARELLKWEEGVVESRNAGPGVGACLLVEQRFEHGIELCSSFGETGVMAEKVGHRAAKAMANFIGSGAAVGRCLADQLLLPMALAGQGSFNTMSPDNHVPTNIGVIEKFLPVRFSIEDHARGTKRISCVTV